jgi:hypothetical protein
MHKRAGWVLVLLLTVSCDLVKQIQEKVTGGPGSSSPSSAGAGTSELKEAIELYRSGQIDSARQRFEALVAANPSSADGFYYLGLCRMAAVPETVPPASPPLPEEESTLEAFNRALSLNPRHAQAAIGIGDLYSRRVPPGRRRPAKDPTTDPYSLALEAYNKALTIDPRLPEAQYHFARFLERVGDLQQAEQAYKTAAEAAATIPEMAPDYYIHYARFLAGRSGREQEAIDQYGLARIYRSEDISLQREIAALYARMGQGYFENNQYSLAEETLKKAYAMFPDKGDPEAQKAEATLQELRAIRR